MNEILASIVGVAAIIAVVVISCSGSVQYRKESEAWYKRNDK